MWKTHNWDLTPAEAVALQRKLSAQVWRRGGPERVSRVAGVDVGFEQDGAITKAAVAILTFPHLQIVDVQVNRIRTCFPYVPGLLSFRELPAVLPAFERLERLPDLILCDGQGYAHPRRFGMACHLGVLLDVPTIGVGKTRLLGQHAPVPDRRGASSPLRHDGRKIGAVLCTRAGVRPLYISVGHRISLARALEFVMACTTRFRLPEPIRAAHREASTH